MKKANIYLHGSHAGILEEQEYCKKYVFTYDCDYNGDSISVTMPIKKESYLFSRFPPFFDGLLPEGVQLEGLLKQKKIDRNDLFSQLIAVGNDTVGAVTIQER
jgi:serine/threonine-protein kinase HipA